VQRFTGISNAAIEVASLALSDTSTVGAKTATASGTLINQMGSTIVVRPR
jgi:translation initiation factor 2B subunit (eIF-2B alpha/beta/delta family)